MAVLNGVTHIFLADGAPPPGVNPSPSYIFTWYAQNGSIITLMGRTHLGVDGAVGTSGTVSGDINVDNITANDLTLTGAGNFVKHELGWKDNVASFSSGKLGGSTNNPSWRQFVGGIYAYRFRNNEQNELFIFFHINHDYRVGTNIFPHIHWAPDGAGSGTVRWGFEYSIAKGHQQDSFATTATVYVEQATTGEAKKHMIAEHPTGILDADLETDSLIMVRVFRDATHGNDTFNDEAFGLACDLHYQSEKELTLNKAPNFDS